MTVRVLYTKNNTKLLFSKNAYDVHSNQNLFVNKTHGKKRE